MKAYRYLREEELNSILAGDVENIGREYDAKKFSKVNSHKYKQGVKYLHFFRNRKGIKHIQDLHKTDFSDYYICEFEIPMLVMMRYLGYGIYETGGYKYYNEKFAEFAIPSSEIKPEYLVCFVMDKEHHDFCERIKSLSKKSNENKVIKKALL